MPLRAAVEVNRFEKLNMCTSLFQVIMKGLSKSVCRSLSHSLLVLVNKHCTINETGNQMQ